MGSVNIRNQRLWGGMGNGRNMFDDCEIAFILLFSDVENVAH